MRASAYWLELGVVVVLGAQRHGRVLGVREFVGLGVAVGVLVGIGVGEFVGLNVGVMVLFERCAWFGCGRVMVGSGVGVLVGRGVVYSLVLVLVYWRARESML